MTVIEPVPAVSVPALRAVGLLSPPCPECGGEQELRVEPSEGEPYSILCHCYTPAAIDVAIEEVSNAQ